MAGILKKTHFILRGYYSAVLWVTAPLLLCMPAMAMEDIAAVRDVLDRMTTANRELNYSGIFTYEHAGVLKTIKVIHAVGKDGVETEKLIHLSGPAREITRQGRALDCWRAENDPLRGSVLQAASERNHFSNYYDLYLRGKDRIAGRPVNVIHLVPKDDYRYGYVLGVDKASGLLLQSMLVAGNRRVLERFQFVDIRIHDAAEPVAEAMAGAKPNEPAAVGQQGCSYQKVVGVSGPWRLGWLPPGFSLAGQTRGEGGDKGTETLLYTDGLSVFSVFIDEEGGSQLPQVQAQRGATVAHLTRLTLNDQDYVISVVGEIPPETARRVAESIVVQWP